MSIHWSKINKSNVILMGLFHSLAFYGLYLTYKGQVSYQAWIFAIILYFITGFSVTGGLHRYFSHRSYKAHKSLDIFYMITSSMAFVGSILWWCRDHRIHHKYSDTQSDPHDSTRGLFYSHIGWLLLNKDKNILVKDSISVDDLKKDKMVMWQHNYYLPLSLFLGILIPSMLMHFLFNDFLGGLLISSFVRIVWTWHCTFCVNSIAHYHGSREFDHNIPSADSLLVSLLTHGEGWHNYHHAYPFDYKASPSLAQYNPTAWVLFFFKKIGLIYETKEAKIKHYFTSKKDMKESYYSQVKDSLAKIQRKIPKDLTKKDLFKTWYSISKTVFFLVFFSLLIISTLNYLPNFIGYTIAFAISWFLLGTTLTGGFDLAHDAAHRSLFSHRWSNNLAGHLFSSLVGWPFHVWRIAHDLHHLHTNNSEKDIAWEPYTLEKIQRLPLFFQFLYKKFRSSIFFVWFAGFFHLLEQLIKVAKNSSRFRSKRKEVLSSILITFVIFSSFLAIIYNYFNIAGLIFLAIIPLCRYYYWLSIFTLLHHTRPDRPFVPNENFENNAGAIQLTGTINVRYGFLVDFLTHNIAWHVPHHVSVAIPHYNLKEATFLLMKEYPNTITDVKFSFGYLQAVLNSCQYVESLKRHRMEAL